MMKASRLRLKISGLTFSYSPLFPGNFLLQDIHLHLTAGECLEILGANGSGKTTLLFLFSGFLTPLSGEIALYLESDASGCKRISARAPDYWKFVYAYAGPESLPVRTPLQHWLNLLCQFHFPDLRRTWKILLRDELRIPERYFSQPVDALSRGMKQRIFISLPFFSDVPHLILLDEPLLGLDGRWREFWIRLVYRRFWETSVSSPHILVLAHPGRHSLFAESQTLHLTHESSTEIYHSVL